MLTIFAVSVMSLHGVAVADDNHVQNISVERSSANVTIAVLSWDTQEDIEWYNIKYKCSGDEKENLRVPGNQSSYTFDVYADQSCKINIRSISDSGEKSDNVKIILASGEPTGEIVESVKNFNNRSNNVPADSTLPTLESAALNEETGVLAITFDEIIANEGFDLSTADYTDRSFSVSNRDTSPSGVAFNPDGTKMFVVGTSSGAIHEYTLSSPFDMSNPSFVRLFSVSSNYPLPTDVAFSTDGTKMFVVDFQSENVYEYTLSSPFNLSDPTFIRDFSVSSQDTSPSGVAFNSDGTKMFVVGTDNGNINEYTLSSPFNISNSSFVRLFSVSSQERSPQDVTFNPSGTKMFVIGNSNGNVNEYALTAPFNISDPSHTGTFDVSSQDTSPTGVAFNPAGTKMFAVGIGSDSVHEYTLTTPVDLSLLFISESGNTNDISLTGARITTVGNSTSIEIKLAESQRQSVIALTTPELDILSAAVSDVSGNQIGASPNNAIAVTNSVVPPPSLDAPTNLSVNVINGTAAEITWTAPTIPANSFYDINSVSYLVNVTDVAASTTVLYTISDGTTTTHTATGLILDKSYQVTVEAKALLSDLTAISSQPTAAVSFDMPTPPSPDAPTNLLVNVINGTAAEITWTAPTVDANEYYTIDDVAYQVTVISSDGSELGDTVDDTSYMVTGLTPGESYNVHVVAYAAVGSKYTVESSPVSASFNMLAVVNDGAGTPPSPSADNTPPTLESATLDEGTGVLAITFDEIIANEGFDVSTAAYTDNSFSVSNKDPEPESVTFNPTGTKMFVVDFQSEKIYEYTLSSPFDVSIASYTRNFSVGSQDTHPKDVTFNPTGTKMFVAGYQNEKIYEYTLTTPFNLSTASYTHNFSISSQDTDPTGVAFNPTGTKMFVLGYQSTNVYEYELSSPFDISSSSYTHHFSVGSQDTHPKDVTFNPTGTKMFVVDSQSEKIYEYELSSPFDVSSSDYKRNFSVSDEESFPTGVAFNPTGTKMFVVGTSSNSIHEYTLTTPVDLSKLFISESASANDISLTGASIETVGNNASISIELTAPQRESVIALAVPELDILSAAVSDVSGNQIVPVADNAIAVTNSVAPPSLAAPTDLSVAVQGTTATITWTAPAIPANPFYDISNVSYLVNVTDTAAGTTVPYTISDGTTTHTTHLLLSKSYQVTVEAKALLSDLTAISSQPTAAVSFDMPTPPSSDAPTNLLVNVINGTAAEITWTAPTVDANEYYTIDDVAYQVTVISSDGSELGDTVDDTSYTVADLIPGESYNVHVYVVIFGPGYFVESSPVSASFNMPAAVVDGGADAAADAQAAADKAALSNKLEIKVTRSTGVINVEMIVNHPDADNYKLDLQCHNYKGAIPPQLFTGKKASVMPADNIISAQFDTERLMGKNCLAKLKIFDVADNILLDKQKGVSIGAHKPSDVTNLVATDKSTSFGAQAYLHFGPSLDPGSKDKLDGYHMDEYTIKTSCTDVLDASISKGNVPDTVLQSSAIIQFNNLPSFATIISDLPLDANCTFSVTGKNWNANQKDKQWSNPVTTTLQTPLTLPGKVLYSYTNDLIPQLPAQKNIPITETPNDIQLTAAMDGSDAIEVSWHPISSDVFSYNLEWNDPTEGSSGFIPFGTKNFVNGDRSTSHMIKDVIPGYTYTIALTLYYGTDADIEFVHRVTIIEYTVANT